MIRTIKGGRSFFYLPDQDHGREKSIFAPFFGHPKATLPALPRLVQVSGAKAVPLLACYDEAKHCYRLEIDAPFDNYPTDDVMADTCRMNDMVQQQLCRDPGQYMWFLKIFDTREDQVGLDGRYEAGSSASAVACSRCPEATRLYVIWPCGPFLLAMVTRHGGGLPCLTARWQGPGRQSGKICQDN